MIILRRLAALNILSNLFLLAKSQQLYTTDCDTCCRSNATHIAWKLVIGVNERALLKVTSPCCEWQTMEHAQRDAYSYLWQRILSFDRPFLETMGFRTDNDDNNSSTMFDPDGLADGLIGPTIEYALKTKLLFPRTDHLPREIWEEYVLNYLHLNEARSNWRPFLFQKLSPLVTTDTGFSKAVLNINTYMWQILAAPGAASITFVSGSTPLIFDPMSVLIYGYASCTGLSILLASALRAVGVPARVVGTAAWNGNRDKGNHNWIEVWQDGWHFLEPTASESSQEADHIDRDPCERWFCRESRWNGTSAYAARLERTEDGLFFPLAWERENTAIPAENRTLYYQQTCGRCT